LSISSFDEQFDLLMNQAAPGAVATGAATGDPPV